MQRLAGFEHPAVNLLGQLDGKLVVHRKPHGQHAAVQLLGHRPGEHGQPLGRVLRRGRVVVAAARVLRLPQAGRVEAHPAQRFVCGGRRRQAGRQRDPFQPLAGRTQQLDQIGRVHVGPRAVVFLQDQPRRQPVAGEMDDVPTGRFHHHRAQLLARHAVLQHAQFDVQAAAAGDVQYPPPQLIAFVPQIQGPDSGRQAEHAQHAKLVRRRLRGAAGPSGQRPGVEHQADVVQRQGPALDRGQFQRAE